MKLDSISTDLKLITGIVPVIGSGGVLTSDYICCKTFSKVFAIVMAYRGAAVDTTITLVEATNVAAGSAATVTKKPRIFINTAVAASDTLVETTAATTYIMNLDTVTTDHLVVFEWDCAKFTAGFDCLAVTLGDVTNAANLYSVLFVGVPRYSGCEDVTAITN